MHRLSLDFAKTRLLLLASHIRPFLGHGHFHLPHLRHHLFFVSFELAALFVHFPFEAQNFLRLSHSGAATVRLVGRQALTGNG